MLAAMKRREFIGLLGSVAATWPAAALAQQQTMPVVGFLRSTTFSNAAHLVGAFRAGLKETGFVEDQNVVVEFRASEGQHSRLPALAAEFVRRPVSVIVGETTSALVAKAATATIPIVFTTAGDPVRDGLVASLNRPGGNVTGVTFLAGVLGSKRLELLRQLVPGASVIGMLTYLGSPEADAERAEVLATAQKIGQPLLVVDAKSLAEIETAFATFSQRRVGALLVGAASFLSTNRQFIADLAARSRIPAIYTLRDNAEAGGLMSYSASNTDAYRQAGLYVGRILKGEKPADLPVMQSTKFEFVINLKTAKAMGLDIPDRLLALADEVIE